MGSRSGLLESLASPSRPGLLLRPWTGRWALTLATQRGPSSAIYPPCTHSCTLASLGHCAPSPQEGVAICLLPGDSRLSRRIKASGPGEPIAGPAWHRGSLPPYRCSSKPAAPSHTYCLYFLSLFLIVVKNLCDHF